VLFVIIPGQRELVRAKQEGREPDAAPGLRGKERSVHNTYFTLPVVFVMISNHYAMTYGSRYNWLLLMAFTFAGASIRAWFVARHKRTLAPSFKDALPALLGISTLAVVIVALAPTIAATPVPVASVDVVNIHEIFQQRCVPCHATNPSQAGFNAPPNGLVFQTMQQVEAHRAEIRLQVSLNAMPLGNVTHMTDDERSRMLAWLDRGAGP